MKNFVYDLTSIFGRVILALVTILTFVLLGLCFLGLALFALCNGKKPANNWNQLFTDFDSWPRWLMVGNMRVLPWHIIIAILAVGIFYYPTIAGTLMRWIALAGFVVMFLEFALYYIHKWAHDLGYTLPTDVEYECD